MNRFTFHPVLLSSLIATLAGCGSVSMPRLAFWTNEPTEMKSPRLVGATLYGCDGGKQLAVRYGAAGQAAMVIFPEREFRLDPAPGGAGRYTNGRTTLAVDGSEASLTEAGAAVLANCKRTAPG
jgi:membrane-bound inhibitor of C-type lysozyme